MQTGRYALRYPADLFQTFGQIAYIFLGDYFVTSSRISTDTSWVRALICVCICLDPCMYVRCGNLSLYNSKQAKRRLYLT